MPAAWRLVPEARAHSPFDGVGARRFGGRWNTPGQPVVYTASSRALAALELLVHLSRPTPPIRYCLFEVALPDECIETVTDPKTLAATASASIRKSTTRFGDAWLREMRSAVLRVPSAIIPEEPNYLLNPLHPDFKAITLGKQTPFASIRDCSRKRNPRLSVVPRSGILKGNVSHARYAQDAKTPRERQGGLA